MDESPLYQQIAEAVRQEILEGKLNPGDRLPSIRQMTAYWNCTPGTVQRAYNELALQGLVVSRTGQGTRVADKPTHSDTSPLRRAALVNRAESFLLESLATGHTPDEVTSAVQQSIERWQAVSHVPIPPASGHVLHFSGSHDPAISLLATHFPQIYTGYQMQTAFPGSLGGLMALAAGQADLAGCHLWDVESGQYNLPFVQRLLPGERVALVTLAHRRQGLILPPGNPLAIQSLEDLAKSGIRFANRQPGSGTRVWLDAALHHAGVNTAKITGYSGQDKLTHSEVARAVASGEANAGVGLEAAARAYGLVFVFLNREQYELVIPQRNSQSQPIEALLNWLASADARNIFSELSGYDFTETGRVRWLEPQ